MQIVFTSSSGLFPPCSSWGHGNAARARLRAAHSRTGLTSISNARPTWPMLTVDLLIIEGRRILPVEIKLGAAVDHYAVAGLRQCMKDLGLRRGWIITTTADRRLMSAGIEIIPWADVASGQVELF